MTYNIVLVICVFTSTETPIEIRYNERTDSISKISITPAVNVLWDIVNEI